MLYWRIQVHTHNLSMQFKLHHQICNVLVNKSGFKSTLEKWTDHRLTIKKEQRKMYHKQ